MPASTENYPVSTVASMLKVSRAVCLRLIRAGELAAERTPQGLRIGRDDLVVWIERQMSLAAQEGHSLAKEPQKK